MAAEPTTSGYLMQYDFYVRWILSSSTLLLVWHVLWQAWDVIFSGHKAVTLILLIVSLALLISGIVTFAPDNSRGYGLVNFIRLVLPAILFFSIQFGLRAQQSLSALAIEKQQLESAHYKTQLQALQAQVDPHFLFNSLNTLRSMVRNGNQQSEQFIMCLSDFYRQTLQHDQEQTITVEKELEVLEAFLFLMKSRNRDAIKTHIEIPSPLLNRKLPKFSLQILVENCFKHNSMTSKTPLMIEIVGSDNGKISVRNKLQPKIGSVAPSGHGLTILEKRYALLGIEHGIAIHNEEQYFTAILKTLPA